MARNGFRTHLASLESEYARLEAENITLRNFLTSNAEAIKALPTHCEACDAEHPEVFREASEAELVLPKPVFQYEGVHQMAPVSTEPVTLTTKTNKNSLTIPELPESEQRGSSKGSRVSIKSNGSSPRDPELAGPDSAGHRQGSKDSKGRMRRGSTQRMMHYLGLESYVAEPGSGEQHKKLFGDIDEMKERIKGQIVKKRYDVSVYYKDTGCAQRIARHNIFELFTLMIIGCNALWIAIDTDYNDQDLLIDADVGFLLVENLFCSYFFFEIIIRFIAFRNKTNCVRDFWFVFDGALVLMMVLETWVATFVLAVTSGGGSSVNFGSVSVLRIARLMRLTRMARMARLLRAVPELMILIKGMIAAARSVFFTLMLLLILLYVFAIAFAQLTKETAVGEEYFSTVALSMNTLWLYATLCEDIPSLAHAVREESVYLVLLLYFFVLAAPLTVMNMLIGVLCEVVSAVATSENEESALSFMKAKVARIFYKLDLDKDGNGMISKDEFKGLVENQEAARAMSDLGVDVLQLVDMADFFFADEESSEGHKELGFHDFMEMVAQLRGNNIATVKDMMHMRKFVRAELNKLRRVIALAGLPSWAKANNTGGTSPENNDNFVHSKTCPDTKALRAAANLDLKDPAASDDIPGGYCSETSTGPLESVTVPGTAS
jgi:hypothetical protein